MKKEILSQLTTECPWRDTLYWYDTIDSTNVQAKQMAKSGAPHGTVLIAGCQTGGRGRMGRSFLSPTGGVYLSVILRPKCAPDKLMHLTCATAVAGCEAVEAVTGICPGIKWTNDLVFNRKKLGGILTEIAVNSATGQVDYAIIGIGINCRKTQFSPELQSTVTSIEEITGCQYSPARLAAALMEKLYKMDKNLLQSKAQIMDSYRCNCITPGMEIKVVRGDEINYGTALDIDEDGGLRVRFSDGTVKTVTSGEVSIRGMYGYL